MNIRCFVPVLFALGAFFGFGVREDVNQGQLPRLPGASLLVGYPPFVLAVTTASETQKLQPGSGDVDSGDRSPIYPSFSRDGSVVASARVKAPNPRRAAIATYSIPEKKWTEYAEGDYRGSVALSLDGSKLAFVAREETSTSLTYRVHIIDLKTGQQSIGPEIPPSDVVVVMSWSPDGKRLAYSKGVIEVWDAETQQTRKITDGTAPAWSPSGEWIAYLDSSQDRRSLCMAIRPDGTGARTLVALPRGRAFVEVLVWSPDSRSLLLNELSDGEKWLMNIDLLDLSTLNLTTKLKHEMPVWAWADTK